MNTVNAYNIAEINKISAYKEVQENIDAAKEVILSRPLVFGQEVCVPFYYPDSSSEDREVNILLGIGGLDGSVQFFSNILDNDTNVDDAGVYVDDASARMTVRGALKYITDKINAMSLDNTPYATYLNDAENSIDIEK